MGNNILKSFGLTDNEVDIFLCLLQKGILNPTQIAKETSLNRPYIYYALERLMEKGYISQIDVGIKKCFQARPLREIFALEEQKLVSLREQLKELEKMEKSPENIHVEVLKGKNVIKNIFRKLMVDVKSGEEILYLGLDENKMEEIEPLYLEKVLNIFKERKISEKVILKKGSKKLSYASTTSYKNLDGDIIGNVAKIIYQDIVIELLYENPIYAIIIKNKNVAETEKKQFYVFWKLAKP